MPKTPTLKDIVNSGITNTPVDLLCVVQDKTFLDNLNAINLSSPQYRRFPATLRADGNIHFPNGESFKYPSTASRAVRKIVENRQDSIPEKTGGWLYWHFKDQAGRWCQIEELRLKAGGQ